MAEVIIGENTEATEEEGRIIHPFSDDVDGTDEPVTMYIVGSIGARYIGGIVGDLSPYVNMFLPLMMMEVPQQGGVSLGLRPLFMSFGLLDFVVVKHDFLYTLKTSLQRDVRLVKAYEEQITSYRAQEMGIVSPTNEEVLKINRR